MTEEECNFERDLSDFHSQATQPESSSEIALEYVSSIFLTLVTVSSTRDNDTTGCLKDNTDSDVEAQISLPSTPRLIMLGGSHVP
ncbi:hypothetical protein PFLUV_G00138070 [Perca fluviatilis]|uniref:Uncharacterized protein n=1 Tax=Perca fluviatilis TaxID=8168 RepID=A0A6A5E581_PERFL|nr:hypothetical protein PFLUV_G00138070 [Perca fluviatilis]